MNTDSVIKFESVSKKFAKSLKRSMFYGMDDIARNMMGLPAHTETLRPDEFWALDSLSFEVRKGETLGIIGANGAGKTTVLKLLSGILLPDKGRIEIDGKVGALIEIGAGFHPMLTGRENIYINGSILGMSKKEIDRKLDSIIDFADIGDFIDSPVKHYSSGMYVRLGFAIAIHCDPDIFLVDEVLAVGDEEFRGKCYDKITELKRRKTTILYISHDLATVERLCDRAILVDNGKLSMVDCTPEVINFYFQKMRREREAILAKVYNDPGRSTQNWGNNAITIAGVSFFNVAGRETQVFTQGEDIRIVMRCFAKQRTANPVFGLIVYSSTGIYLGGTNSMSGERIAQVEGSFTVEYNLTGCPFLPGKYVMSLAVHDESGENVYDYHHQSYPFEVIQSTAHLSLIYSGYIMIPCHWNYQNENRTS